MIKQILKRAKKYEAYKQYIDKLQEQRAAQRDQNISTFDIAASVEQEILAEKEAKRKARNKRKANKSK